MAIAPSESQDVYLFSYDFRGEKYSLEVPAASSAEAQHRVSIMANAKFDGVVKMKIGNATGPVSRWLAKLGL